MISLVCLTGCVSIYCPAPREPEEPDAIPSWYTRDLDAQINPNVDPASS